jgi:hypothetical protein
MGAVHVSAIRLSEDVKKLMRQLTESLAVDDGNETP